MLLLLGDEDFLQGGLLQYGWLSASWLCEAILALVALCHSAVQQCNLVGSTGHALPK
jgi:hypothetical protein